MNFLTIWLKHLFKSNNNIVSAENTDINKTTQTDKDKFEKAMKFIRVVEGGKFFHPNDPGGFTNMGLTQRDYPKLDLKNLTREEADNIFYKDYWKKSVASKLPDPAFISYFDAVVNTGAGRANKILQKVVGVEVDGKVGKITLEAVKKYGEPKKLAIALAEGKQDFYLSLVSKNKKFGSFIRGWSRRTNALKEYINSGSFSW
jgi:lysozyme family protein